MKVMERSSCRTFSSCSTAALRFWKDTRTAWVNSWSGTAPPRTDCCCSSWTGNHRSFSYRPVGSVMLHWRKKGGDLHSEAGAELSGQKVDGKVQLMEELTEVPLYWDLLPAPCSHH